MKRLFTLLLFSVFSLSLSAQIDVSVDSYKYEIDDTTTHQFSFSVTNTESDTIEIFWKLIKDSEFPRDWKTQVCDGNLCFGPNVDQCPPSLPNVLFGNAVSQGWSVKIDPQGVPGKGLIHMEFYTDSDYQTLVFSTEVEACFVVNGVASSTEDEIYNNSMTLFPNPTIEYFSIKNDRNVAKVSLMNVIGKEVWSKNHRPNTQYDVADLYKGMYIVRLIDSSGKLIKTMRLNKTSI